MCDGYSSDSDYVVDHYVQPDKISRLPNNSVDADILGNFDNSKRNEKGELILKSDHGYLEEETENDDNSSNAEDYINTSNDEEDKGNGKLTDEQIMNLLRGSCKKDRYVLYVTNLNVLTTKNDLEQYFSNAGQIKGIRIPKKYKRKNAFAFIEMSTFDGFKNALQLHNTILNGNCIKIQISEGGKKKSANKKNILKQKNRKLSEMRMEYKSFTKSGKNYDKNLKKELAKEYEKNRKKWRKPKTMKK